MHFIGEKIGTNIIIAKDEEKTKKYKHGCYWIVKCSICGKERSCRSDNLKRKCRSCAAKQRTDNDNITIIDNLVGKQFGYWQVISKAQKNNYWTCMCMNCGTIKDVFRGNLTQGLSKSCGCVSSWGEAQIIYWLKFFKIEYKKEYIFKDLKTNKDGFPRFDFAIFKDNKLLYLIEYDGKQHYSYDKNWNMKEEDYKRLQYIDNLKTEYCKKNKIPLYRFNNFCNLEEEIKELALNYS
jgi:hypothetical protein